MQREEIANCYFVPLKALQKVSSFVSTRVENQNKCRRNLYQLQLANNGTKPRSRPMTYHAALSAAIYAQDWNKLLYLLRKMPVSEMRSDRKNNLHIYIRAYTILLLNHPFAKANGLIDDYLHMVLGCRSEENKKAVVKVLITLTEQLYAGTLAARRETL